MTHRSSTFSRTAVPRPSTGVVPVPEVSLRNATQATAADHWLHCGMRIAETLEGQLWCEVLVTVLLPPMRCSVIRQDVQAS